MVEPGLDKHEWESWWQQFEEDVETSPAEALSELDRLTVEMLEARGYALDDPVAREGDDRDIIAEYVAAHETTQAVEQGKDVTREDIRRGDRRLPRAARLSAGRARRTVGFEHRRRIGTDPCATSRYRRPRGWWAFHPTRVGAWARD